MEEAEAAGAARRTRLTQLGIVVAVVVVAIVVILIATGGGCKEGIRKTGGKAEEQSGRAKSPRCSAASRRAANCSATPTRR